MTSELATGSDWRDDSEGWYVADIDGALISASVISRTVTLDDH